MEANRFSLADNQSAVHVLIPCWCLWSSSSLSWRGNWRRSTSDSRRKSASTSSWSSRTKASERTPCSRPCPTTAARPPAPGRARPPTAPRRRTRRRPIAAPGTGAWTIALSHWPIPLPRPLPSCRRQRCRSVKIIVKRRMHSFIWGL